MHHPANKRTESALLNLAGGQCEDTQQLDHYAD
jgi:hypothetical protein